MRRAFLLTATALLCAANASAQQTPVRGRPECVLTSTQAGGAARRTAATGDLPSTGQRASDTRTTVPAGEYDIVLDVPNLCVDSIRLVVQNLSAHVALDARVANLVRLNAGANVRIDEVNLGIRDVRAEALLLVDLDNVRLIVDDLLTMIDNNPEIVNSLVATLGSTMETAGTLATTALQPDGVVSQAVGAVGQTLENLTQPGGVLSQTVNTLGQTVQRTFDMTGRLVDRTLDTTGRVVGEVAAGNLLEMTLVRQVTNAGGGTLRTVRDTAGNLFEVSVDAAGRVLGARALPRQ